jgi:hypothetical protein
MQELRNVAGMDINKQQNMKVSENDIEKNLFYMDEKGTIVNYLLHPPVMMMTKDDIISLVQGLSQNKIVMTQIKRMTLMKQLNQKNLQNIKNKANVELPDKLQKGYSLFQSNLNQCYKQLDLI